MIAAVAVAVLAAGMAQAQYKQNAPGAKQPPAGVQPGGPAVQMIPPQPATDTALDSARRISREDAMKMVREGKAVYVDVRAKDQYDISHIKGAISIPGSELQTRWKDLPPGKYLITYCA